MDSITAYRRLAQILTTASPVSIEIVPGTEVDLLGMVANDPHHPFLLVEGNLGIPQAVLFQTYLLAVKQLSHFPVSRLREGVDSGDDICDLVSSTAIILITNPAHNTALNRRKRLIQMNSPYLGPGDELNITTVLLKIKQASKSSLLWHHRRWLLRHLYASSESSASSAQSEGADSLKDVAIPLDVLSAEFALTSHAGEVYPRNYHCWLHRYICAQSLISRISENVSRFLEVLQLELRTSQMWVELHVADYTAVQYLSRLISMLEEHNIQLEPPLPPRLPPSELLSFSRNVTVVDKYPIMSHALSLILYYPTHESLWLYLRACYISRDQTWYSTQGILEFSLAFHEDTRLDGDMPTFTHTAKALVEQTLTRVRAEDVSIIQRHALHLYIWILLSTGMLQIDDGLIHRLLTGQEQPTGQELRELRST